MTAQRRMGSEASGESCPDTLKSPLAFPPKQNDGRFKGLVAELLVIDGSRARSYRK
jgi:hypothetical protein